MEHLFIYPVLLFVTYLLYKVLKIESRQELVEERRGSPP